jgi:serine/threonine protein kinase
MSINQPLVPDHTDECTCGRCQETVSWVPDRRDFKAEFSYESTLGQGREGRAELWTHNTDPDKKCVVKIVRKEKPPGVREIPHEAEILMCLPVHPRILFLYAFQQGAPRPDQNTMIYEYCDNGDLESLKETYQDTELAIPEALLFNIFMQLSSALAFLHSGYCRANPPEERANWEPIIHRDIKPSNILLQSSPDNSVYPIVKLADFGLATKLPPSSQGFPEDPEREASFFNGGTPLYQPPEKPFAGTKAGDIYAAGAVLHFLALGEPPVNANLDAMPASVIPINFPPSERWSQWLMGSATEPWEGTYSGELNGFMLWCLDEEAEMRPSGVALFEALRRVWEFVVSMVGDEEDLGYVSGFMSEGHLGRMKHLMG